MSSVLLPLGRLRALLVLGRISNLPTVWSNCLAAWWLAGGGSSDRFGLLCAGTTFLYTGGMFLNDAFDVEFDLRHRPERPIPSGGISARTVWVWSVIWLVTGWLVLLPLGKSSAAIAALLLATIVVYDAVHKRTSLAPFLMAACRFLVYVVAASATGHTPSPALLWRAAALAAYIIGLSYLARGESTGTNIWRWTLPLLFTPLALRMLDRGSGTLPIWAVAAVQGAWSLWCLVGAKVSPKPYLGGGVAGLLAGIVLVDWLAAADCGGGAVFVGLFFGALLLQRIVPAT